MKNIHYDLKLLAVLVKLLWQWLVSVPATCPDSPVPKTYLPGLLKPSGEKKIIYIYNIKTRLKVCRFHNKLITLIIRIKMEKGIRKPYIQNLIKKVSAKGPVI